ncbi:MAG: hypothetical protein KC621_08390 [Myxococcales bacterium]|nr:hypothetical protein [Myxococcales bacterium]
MWLVGWLACTPSPTDVVDRPTSTSDTGSTPTTPTAETGTPPEPCERPPVVAGDLHSAEAMALCEAHEDLSLSGNLHLDGGGVVDLPCLCDLGGNLVIGDVSSVGLPRLRGTAGQILVDASPALTVLELPALTQVGRNLAVLDAPALTRLSAPALAHIASDLRLERSPLLSTIELTALDRVGDTISLSDLPALTTLDGLSALRDVEWGLYVNGTGLVVASLPGLERMGGPLALVGNASLERVEGFPRSREIAELRVNDAPHLTSIGGFAPDTWLWDLRLKDDPLLSALDLPAQTDIVGVVELEHVPLLASAPHVSAVTDIFNVRLVDTGLVDLDDFEALERVLSNLVIVDNAQLPTLKAVALAVRVDVGGTTTVRGNGP